MTQILRRTESDLGSLLIHDDTDDGPPFVAAGAPWFMTLFGRDSLLTAWMALPLDVGVSVGTLQQLAEAQGRRVDPDHRRAARPDPARDPRRPGEHRRARRNHLLRFGRRDTAFRHAARRVLAVGRRRRTSVRSLLPAADAALAWVENGTATGTATGLSNTGAPPTVG